MYKQAVLSLSKKLLRRYKHTAVRTARKLVPKRKQLVLLFGGRSQFWPGMGRELYAKEPVFRNAIHTCEEIFSEFINDASILPNFEGPLNNEAITREAAIPLVISSIQLGIYEMLKQEGIRPHAVMGLSLGEGLAAYAAGALDLRSALQLCVEGARISQIENNDYLPLYVQTSLQDFPTTPLVTPIYEVGDQSVLALCHKNEKELAGKFLEQSGLHWTVPHNETTWAYHTYKIEKLRPVLAKNSAFFDPLPLQCDLYSCTAGGLIPKGSIIDNSFWFDIKCRPVLTHSTIRAVSWMDAPLIVHVGPTSVQRPQLLRSAGQRANNIVMLDTLRKDEGELKVFATAQKTILNTRLQKYPEQKEFLQSFDLNSPAVQANPHPHFDYLRRRGSVHFIPVNNTWLVLDYADIEHALKNPQVFSSTLHKTFDECLVGSDPPHHTLVRSMLQPLFSSQVYAAVGEFTTSYAHQLLDKLPAKFNVVDEFSLPLAQAVVAEFLGLPEAGARELQQCITGHVYAMGHLDNLYTFFKKYLEQNNTGAAGLLLNAVKEEKISMEGAVKLMRLLWVAGMTTTSMLLSTAIHFVAKDELLREQLMGNDQLLNRFIDECLRLEAPELDLKRITTADTILGNKNIPAGSIVMLSLASANRDAKYFERPGEIILDRPAKQHLSFGGGYHYCLGVGMAKLEAKHALKVILERLPKLRLTAGRPPAYFPSPHFRGLATLEVCTNV